MNEQLITVFQSATLHKLSMNQVPLKWSLRCKCSKKNSSPFSVTIIKLKATCPSATCLTHTRARWRRLWACPPRSGPEALCKRVATSIACVHLSCPMRVLRHGQALCLGHPSVCLISYNTKVKPRWQVLFPLEWLGRCDAIVPLLHSAGLGHFGFSICTSYSQAVLPLVRTGLLYHIFLHNQQLWCLWHNFFYCSPKASYITYPFDTK